MATQDLTLYEPQRHNIIVMPLVDPAQAKDAMERYEALKSAIVQDSDYHTIGNGPNARKFLKKAFWRRVGTFFGLSLKLVSEEVIFDERTPQVYGYSVIYSATAPNGAYMEGDGMCMSNERAGMRRHDVRATAHTRAKNRAISDLVGGGEVSADEMPDYVDATPPQPTRQAPVPARPMPAADETRKVVTPQITKDRARIQAEPTPETPITYTVEESPTATNVDDLVKLALAKQIHDLKLELGISPKQYQSIVRTCSSNDELLAKLQELADAKADGFPLDGPARKVAQA